MKKLGFLMIVCASGFVFSQVAAKIISVRDLTPEELTPLRQMREVSLKAGREFPEYNPAGRYITIHATGLDSNPEFVLVEFEQGGKVFKLGYDDFSLDMGDRYVVRQPD